MCDCYESFINSGSCTTTEEEGGRNRSRGMKINTDPIRSYLSSYTEDFVYVREGIRGRKRCGRGRFSNTSWIITVTVVSAHRKVTARNNGGTVCLQQPPYRYRARLA